MYGTGTKRMLNMLILDILKEYSDCDHRLLQQDIIDLLRTNYGMDCERRAVKSNIVSLREMGYNIVSKQGYYLEEREFTDAELRLLIDGVFTSEAITDKEAHELVDTILIYNMRYKDSVEDRVHTKLSSRLQEIYTMLGQIPEVLEDVWVAMAQNDE